MALIFDTGPLYATLDTSDIDHVRCRQLVLRTREPRVIPAPVLVEVDYLIHTRFRAAAFLALLDDIGRGAYVVEDLRLDDYVRVSDICEQYADNDIGFVDASVLAIVERLNEPKLATLDHRHFGMLRPRHITALQFVA